jgi:hypothetical protein
MPKTIEQLAAEYEASAQHCRDASAHWRANRELHGHFHWITMGLWDQLTAAWRASDRAWHAYNEAYRAVPA